MFLEAIILGLIIGFIKKGNINNLNKIKFNGLSILFIILVADLALRQFIVRSNSQLAITLFALYPKFNLIVYFLTIVVLSLNNHLNHMRVIQSGYVLNFLPMVFNEGKMPVSGEAMAKLGKLTEIEFLKNNLYLGHSLMEESTRFKSLSDVIAVPFPIPKVISAGDIVLSIGIIMFIVHHMKNEKNT